MKRNSLEGLIFWGSIEAFERERRTQVRFYSRTKEEGILGIESTSKFKLHHSYKKEERTVNNLPKEGLKGYIGSSVKGICLTKIKYFLKKYKE